MIKCINFFENVKERCFQMLFYVKSKRALTSLPHLLLPRQSGTHWPEASAADTQQHTAHTENSMQEEVQGFKIGKHLKTWDHAYTKTLDFFYWVSYHQNIQKSLPFFQNQSPFLFFSLPLRNAVDFLYQIKPT